VIQTDRLILRPWREADLEPFLAMSADPEVMFWRGGVPTSEDANARFERFACGIASRGFGRWAPSAEPTALSSASAAWRRIQTCR
jgi:RimJ/RimL family protein N-acetyltransferase